MADRRNTPTAEGIISSHEIFKFKPRPVLEKLRIPGKNGTGKRRVGGGKGSEDSIPSHRSFLPGEKAYLRVAGETPNLKCVIKEKLENLSYRILLGGQVRVAHANQLIKFEPIPVIIAGTLTGEHTNSDSQVTEEDDAEDTEEMGSQTQERPHRNRRVPERFKAVDFRIKRKQF